jgi:hypothetical protein
MICHFIAQLNTAGSMKRLCGHAGSNGTSELIFADWIGTF